MMGGVQNARNYYETTMRIGHPGPDGAPVIDHPLLQGGIVGLAESISKQYCFDI